MTTVLITQRLQRDFADTSGPRSHASLLHASYSDAASLFGTIPSAGMEWLAGLGPIGRDQRHSPQSAQDLARFGRLVAEGELARDHHLQHELIHHIGSVRESALTGHPQWPQDPSRRTQAVARAVYRVPPSRSIRNPTVR